MIKQSVQDIKLLIIHSRSLWIKTAVSAQVYMHMFLVPDIPQVRRDVQLLYTPGIGIHSYTGRGILLRGEL